MKVVALVLLLLLGSSLALERDDDPVRSFECDPSCGDTEFCGRDLQCHAYSCENWYKLGHPLFTGYVPDESEDLYCQDLMEDRTFFQRSPPCKDELPLGAEFIAPDAAATSCLDPHRDEQLASYSMTRKCTARPTSETGFVCYDMSPNTDLETYAADYIQQTRTLNGTHSYKLYVEGYHMVHDGHDCPDGCVTSYGEFRGLGGNGSSVFNATAAQAALYSYAFAVDKDSYLPQDCTGGCRLHEFCGTDGQCHEIDCDNFWWYGPQDFTGRQDDDTASLTCSWELQTSSANPCGTEEWPVAVQYLCQPEFSYSYGRLCGGLGGQREALHSLPFYRMCTAKPNPTQDFVCFDMKGVSDMKDYTSEYLQSSKESNCTDAMKKVEQRSWLASSKQEQEETWRPYHHQTHRIMNHEASLSLYLGAPYDTADNPLDLDLLEHALLAQLEGEPSGSFESGAFSFGPNLGVGIVFALMILVLGLIG